MREFLSKFLSAMVLLCVLLAGLPAHRAHASSILVNTSADQDSWLAMVADGKCGLREAIANADADSVTYSDCTGGSGTDTISFSGTYMITLGALGELSVSSPIIIEGQGLGKTIIQADPGPNTSTYRVFRVNQTGDLTLDGVTVSNGRCNGSCTSGGNSGGGIYNLGGTVTVQNSEVSGNYAGAGGGIENEGGLITLTNSQIHDNVAGSGGGIFSWRYGGAKPTATNTSFSNNHADSGQGGAIWNSGDLAVASSSFSQNTASSGGALFNEEQGPFTSVGLSLSNSVLVGNTADNGGALYNRDSHTLSVSNSTFSGNGATVDGGAIYSEAGTLKLARSTISGNNAQVGGGIYNLDATTAASNLTVSGNQAVFNGGGIYSHGNGLTLTHGTLSDNYAGGAGGGLFVAGTLNYANTIVANSTDASAHDCYASALGINKGNLVEDGSCSPALSGDPKLGPLAANGGPTKTMALLAGSKAIDKAQSTACPATDQRGVTRPQGPRCDIGAFELKQTKVIYRSIGSQDGWILESNETSGVGGTLNGGGTTLNLGDDASRRQYRAILSFSTGALPDGAVITSAALKFKKAGLVGANPFSTLGNLLADVKKGSFSGSPALQLSDFQAASSKDAVLSYGSSTVSGWYARALASTNLGYISKTTPTQFRLRFKLDDNNNSVADYLKLYSGNAAMTYQPQLVITYYVP